MLRACRLTVHLLCTQSLMHDDTPIRDWIYAHTHQSHRGATRTLFRGGKNFFSKFQLFFRTMAVYCGRCVRALVRSFSTLAVTAESRRAAQRQRSRRKKLGESRINDTGNDRPIAPMAGTLRRDVSSRLAYFYPGAHVRLFTGGLILRGAQLIVDIGRISISAP